MRDIHTGIRINASPDRIWQALLSSPGIPREIRDAINERRFGHPMKVPMSNGGRTATLTVTLIASDPSREIRWNGHLWIPGLFDGVHRFEIREETGGMTLLIQRETFTGLLVPFLSRTIRDTGKKFESVNAAIKDRAEQESA